MATLRNFATGILRLPGTPASQPLNRHHSRDATPTLATLGRSFSMTETDITSPCKGLAPDPPGFPCNRGDFVMRILFLLPVLP
jgi:hypothetical protein